MPRGNYLRAVVLVHADVEVLGPSTVLGTVGLRKRTDHLVIGNDVRASHLVGDPLKDTDPAQRLGEPSTPGVDHVALHVRLHQPVPDGLKPQQAGVLVDHLHGHFRHLVLDELPLAVDLLIIVSLVETLDDEKKLREATVRSASSPVDHAVFYVKGLVVPLDRCAVFRQRVGVHRRLPQQVGDVLVTTLDLSAEFPAPAGHRQTHHGDTAHDGQRRRTHVEREAQGEPHTSTHAQKGELQLLDVHVNSDFRRNERTAMPSLQTRMACKRTPVNARARISA
jgi:hypothetical protein